jgi:Nuclease-related domain
MRIETNQQLIKRNKRNANYLFFFSMGVIGLALFANTTVINTSDTNTLNLISIFLWIALPVSLVSTFTSINLTNQWVRPPRPENAIPDGLKGLSKKSVLYNYYHMPVRHVLIAPQGVFAIVTRFQEGNFTVENDKWKGQRGPLSFLTTFMRRDAIGNPTEEAQKAAAHIAKLLEKDFPGLTVNPLIVFVHPRATVTEIGENSIPILYTDEEKTPNLRDFLRDRLQQLEAEEAARIASGKTGKNKPAPASESLLIDPTAVADALEENTLV